MLLTSDLHHLYCCHKAVGAIVKRFFSPLFFHSSRSHSVRTHLKLFLFSFVFSLSGMVGWGDGGRLVFDATDPLFPSLPPLQSTLLCTVIHFSFRMFPGYKSFFSLSLLLLYLALSLALAPQCDGFMLRCTFRLCVGWCCGLASGSL